MKIKTNDNVIVIAGKDKGKRGKVIEAFPKDDKVIVEGVNMKKKHQRAKKSGLKGETITFAAPIHVSNVMIEDPKGKKPTRIGYQMVNGKKVRVAKKSGSEIK
jgi:large subunit ribosomal protein L24